MARYVARLSANALLHLVEKDPVPHTLFDIRPAARREADPVPTVAERVCVATSVDRLGDQLADVATWNESFPSGPSHPAYNNLLVFLTQDKATAELAASKAVKHNYQRCLYTTDALAAADVGTLDITYINRDAVAHLLDLVASGTVTEAPFFVDLRRHDERALYGAIKGTVHVPTEMWPFALDSTAGAFERVTQLPPPERSQLVVLQCRSNRRAGWAARLAMERGFKRVLVYKQGSYGWRLDEQVKAYPSYEAGDALPDPEPFTIEHVDKDAAAVELQQLGIL